MSDGEAFSRRNSVRAARRRGFSDNHPATRRDHLAHPPLRSRSSLLRTGTEAAPQWTLRCPRHEYGVCYFGLSAEAAFVEMLLRNPSSRFLSAGDLAARSIATGRLARSVKLAQLHGAGLKRLGISIDTVHGPYSVCRRLALAVFRHSAQVDGFEYRSRFDNDELCIALFDRSRDAVVIEESVGIIDDLAWLGTLLDRYGVGLNP